MTRSRRDLAKLAVTFWLGPLSATARAAEPAATRVEGANRIDAFLVRWWGAKGSELDRPIYRVARIDNERLEVRHIIVKGRPLDDYVLPYWPIRSCLAILNRPAELAHQARVKITREGKFQRESLVAHEGFEFATIGQADVLKITNRGSGETALMEQFLVIAKGNPAIHVMARVTNTSDKPFQDVEQQIHYGQRFNWGDFAAPRGDDYVAVKPGDYGEAQAFHAFSAGMNRGYEFIAGEGCHVAYTCFKEINRWRATMTGKVVTLAAGESTTMRYAIRTTDRRLTQPTRGEASPVPNPSEARFRRVTPTVLKTAPVRHEGRVMLPQIVADLKRPKIRGLNLRAGFPQALKDLDTLKAWGCNLVIIGIGKPEQTRQVIQRGHKLGMEMFVAGRGRWTKGPPRFDALYDKPLPPSQQADSHGQDEDHYYWYGHQPTRDFQADFGKPTGRATQEEKVRYMARCFADRWRGVLNTVRRHAPDGGIWFYMPSPGIAHIDALDHYDVFFREIAKLGRPLTVFPFYYGIEYNQAEYMVRRWKDAGVHRVGFLPMRGFMARPNQFIRAITAARRGQADGTCGFAFPISAEKPGNAWQWKSVMLAAQANFPTPELDAFCLIEEPAELVEALAANDFVILSGDADVSGFAKRLGELLPGRVEPSRSVPDPPSPAAFTILVGPATKRAPNAWPVDISGLRLGGGKGCIQMQGRTVGLFGSDAVGLGHAMALLERFAELARAERRKAKSTTTRSDQKQIERDQLRALDEPAATQTRDIIRAMRDVAG